MLHLIAHVLGLDTQDSYWYDAWSGCIPAIIGAGSLAFAALTVYMVFNCHEWGCWKPGRFPVAGGQHRCCRHHHPDPAIRNRQPGHLHAAHREHLARREGGS